MTQQRGNWRRCTVKQKEQLLPLRSGGGGSTGLVAAAVIGVVSTFQQALVRVDELLVRQRDWVP